MADEERVMTRARWVTAGEFNYREACRLLMRVDSHSKANPADVTQWLAQAQVHATLAVACQQAVRNAP